MESTENFREPLARRVERLAIKSNAPTEADAQVFADKLKRLGLTCEYAQKDSLESTIVEMREALPKGRVPAFFIAEEKCVRGAFSRLSHAFNEAASSTTTHDAFDQFWAKNASAPEAVEFFEAILENNPGGTDFLSRLAGVEYPSVDFGTQFYRNNREGLIFISRLAAEDVVPVASGPWVPQFSLVMSQFVSDLSTLSHEKWFDVLCGKEEKLDKFHTLPDQQPGKKWAATVKRSRDPQWTEQETVVDAVKIWLDGIAQEAAAAVEGSIDRPSLEAVTTGAFGAVPDQNTDHFDSRSAKDGDTNLKVYIAFNPRLIRDPDSGEEVCDVDGVGVVSLTWRVQIENYTKSSETKRRHKYAFSCVTRGLRYYSVYKENENTTTFSDQLREDLRLLK